jgi:hypothetical protein
MRPEKRWNRNMLFVPFVFFCSNWIGKEGIKSRCLCPQLIRLIRGQEKHLKISAAAAPRQAIRRKNIFSNLVLNAVVA